MWYPVRIHRSVVNDLTKPLMTEKGFSLIAVYFITEMQFAGIVQDRFVG